MTQPKFVPRPGQVDYTNIRYAPAVNIILEHDGKIFCVKRSDDMRLYPGYWHWPSGFLDDDKSIEEKVYEELAEELSIQRSDVISITRGTVIVDESPQYKKTWLLMPVHVKVKTPKTKLDWEASGGRWFTPTEVKNLHHIPGALASAVQFFPEVL